ncbi:hypothetical protein WICPIJ_002869 [Wickerhamomyces pijperi]|uniref:Uncharacterized protein n=1 Tax=Wickerhamomyces pijperi TaxID=599730 RepID=A0A9P8QAN8_WICPI|nr:hypothetical protein WICPIJ_002869 [Wickerhamomyces pijperi]
MPHYKIELQHEINATPAQVRSILLDFPKYNSWNHFINDPTIIKSKANSQDPYDLQTGDVISLNFTLFNMKATPEILKNTEDEFKWLGVGGAKFIFAGAHSFKFESLDGGKRCRLVHGEEFTGFTVGLYRWLKGEETEEHFRRISEKIKERAEAL